MGAGRARVRWSSQIPHGLVRSRPGAFPAQCCFRVIYFSFTLFPTFSLLVRRGPVEAADVENIRLTRMV